MGSRPDILAFNGLRGVAAWWVVLYHFDAVVPLPNVFRGIVHDGALAVDIFFVLSGFVIALSYTRVFAERARLRDWLWFIGIRLARIYPLHIAMLLAYAAIPLALSVTDRPPSRLYDGSYFIQSLVLVQNWGFAEQLAWNPPAWSISAELLFYVVFPVLTLCLVPFGRTKLGLLIAVGIIGLGLFCLGLAVGSLRADISRVGAVRCVLECALGMCAFYATKGVSPSRWMSYSALAAAAVLISFYAVGLAPDYAVLPYAFALILCGLIDPKLPLSRLLSFRPLLWLGTVSFSTYMVHYFIRDWFKLLLVGHIPDWLLMVTYILTVALASAMLYKFVEVPGRKAGRRLAERVAMRSAQPLLPNQGAR